MAALVSSMATCSQVTIYHLQDVSHVKKKKEDKVALKMLHTT
jgi:hypothetical protein